MFWVTRCSSRARSAARCFFGEISWRAILRIADELLEEEDFAIDVSPHVMGIKEFEHVKARERRIARDILQEGIPV